MAKAVHFERPRVGWKSKAKGTMVDSASGALEEIPRRKLLPRSQHVLSGPLRASHLGVLSLGDPLVLLGKRPRQEVPGGRDVE